MKKQVLLEYLIRTKSIDLNLKTETLGYTALFVAIQQSNINLINYLLSAGSDIHQTSHSGQNCFVYNIDCCLEEQKVTKIKSIPNSLSPGEEKGKGNRLEILQILLERGSDIDSIINPILGNTILLHLCTKQVASQYSCHFVKTIVNILLENGSNQFIKNLKGNDCMHLIEDNPYKNEIRPLLLRTRQKYFNSKPNQNLNMEAHTDDDNTCKFYCF